MGVSYYMEISHKDVRSIGNLPTPALFRSYPQLFNVFDEWIQVKAEEQNTKKWWKQRGLEQSNFWYDSRTTFLKFSVDGDAVSYLQWS